MIFIIQNKVFKQGKDPKFPQNRKPMSPQLSQEDLREDPTGEIEEICLHQQLDSGRAIRFYAGLLHHSSVNQTEYVISGFEIKMTTIQQSL